MTLTEFLRVLYIDFCNPLHRHKKSATVKRSLFEGITVTEIFDDGRTHGSSVWREEYKVSEKVFWEAFHGRYITLIPAPSNRFREFWITERGIEWVVSSAQSQPSK